MYQFLFEISNFFSEPITTFINTYEHSPLVTAFLLGVIGAFAPCQLTGNISAITFYGQRKIQKDIWLEVLFFILGKIMIFSVIGLFAWNFGQTFEREMTNYFPLFRKMIGPLLLLTGVVLIGGVKLKFINRLTQRIPVIMKEGKVGSFLLGASFSLAFCPTMFVLFFVWLMPVVGSSSYGFTLPAIFAIATSIPLLVIFALIEAVNVKGVVMKKSKKVGVVVQRVAGILLMIIGLFDTITYWGI
ncbi:sulfite exporter TauE/SafE family protein [Lysinibacillus sp. BW-2-10]|uniref:urease accessory protein UreH domain-containing protein n=1 Tax=Lysinibacillus sp. BW-2-10 TaxID=2590030 RepID=UPI00117E347B|nr:sulfite exporter TauE/SafE family protein [Lysinibacillus sp. BW-2-10]TSI06213.1 sulfite exporter TauE/SafE family protein [Lysinibacillus sp. BW-2-10]